MNELQKTRSCQQFQSAKDKFLKSSSLLERCFDQSVLTEVLQTYAQDFRDRLFSPLNTLWVFSTQILNADHSCRAAVAHYIATLKGRSCSLATGAYCQARKRLTEKLIKVLFLRQAEKIISQVKSDWLWKNRRVKMVDGSTVSMPDSKDNRDHFPATNKKRNLNEFPLARIVVVICKTTGILVNAAIGTYQGKGSGETSLFRQLLSSFDVGDICLFDRYYAGFFCLAALKLKGVDSVTRQHHLRTVNATKRLGKNDHLFVIQKPQKPGWMDMEEYKKFPDELKLRQINVHVQNPGFRTKSIEVITTLLDLQYSPEELAELYRDRWFVEVDLRSIKSVMGMHILRCQTAEMVKKEIWMHFFTYNLIRAVILDAAKVHQKPPREISFKAALQLLSSIRLGMTEVSSKAWSEIYFKILTSLGNQTVGKRPDRYEPRLKKRRSNNKYLSVSRERAKKDLKLMNLN